jgi:hypothetical protein
VAATSTLGRGPGKAKAQYSIAAGPICDCHHGCCSFFLLPAPPLPSCSVVRPATLPETSHARTATHAARCGALAAVAPATHTERISSAPQAGAVAWTRSLGRGSAAPTVAPAARTGTHVTAPAVAWPTGPRSTHWRSGPISVRDIWAGMSLLRLWGSDRECVQIRSAPPISLLLRSSWRSGTWAPTQPRCHH